ncbi:MAG: class II fructose-bisphosphatase [Myxococcales bacterium]|nr:class II fructose-bisphosphatase [Myxococcales bacterium]MCB9645810.1 class II fructose-bisphosphatase [Deltaproteobacteria bacterium]
MPLSNAFIHALRVVTENAALAAFDWVGRGEKELGDGAAVDAMRDALARIPVCGEIVIGEGEKDEAPHLFRGERIGCLEREPEWDIAVDPVEGTTFLAHGLAGSMAVIGLAPRGTMFDPGPAFYMEKLVVCGPARGKVDPRWPPEQIVAAVAEAMKKPVEDVTVFVLDKPRHRDLVARLRATGCRVSLQAAGDVAGALLAAITESPVDILMGTGGTPEGVLVAGAVNALGGDMFGRLDPQRPDEAAAVAEAGLDTTRWYGLDELTSSNDTLFCATGITSGHLCSGIDRTAKLDRIQTLLISGRTRERQLLTTWRARN